jgi:hypothetical protein
VLSRAVNNASYKYFKLTRRKVKVIGVDASDCNYYDTSCYQQMSLNSKTYVFSSIVTGSRQ